MTIKEKILLESKIWVVEKESLDAHYLKNLSRAQKAHTLWIGSSDNLISVRELTNTDPGEILIHRNMATQVRPDDISLMATLEHAVEIAGVQYIIVCGYSHCSGIRDVVQGNTRQPHIRKWLEELQDLYDQRGPELQDLDSNQQEKRLCEINIKAQILNLSNLEVIRKVWENGKEIILLGWYFDLNSGTIKEVFSMQAKDVLKQMASLV